jgi:hypothetical protein
MDQRIVISSLAMDLKRVAQGLQRGSETMAVRFKDESIKRCREIQPESLPSYIVKIITNTQITLHQWNNNTAEDALMYSVLLQNYVLHYPNS